MHERRQRSLSRRPHEAVRHIRFQAYGITLRSYARRKDSNGNVIGCLSACMAGINAQDPSYNCCVGCLASDAFVSTS